MSDSRSVSLATTYHDPDGRLYNQIARVLPVLTSVFGGLAIQASHAAAARSLELLAEAGASVQQERPDQTSSIFSLGIGRRAALSLALRYDAPCMMYCDFDRALHWAEHYPAELAQVVAQIPAYDFTVLGRTQRAFDTHPRTQSDTEAIINHVFATVSGQAWDVTAAARGLSRRAAQAILAGCPEKSLGVDCAWPLFLQRADGFSLAYIATEGMEFETGDRHNDDIAAAGGYKRWLAQLDADPRRWAARLEFARVEVEAMLPYSY